MERFELWVSVYVLAFIFRASKCCLQSSNEREAKGKPNIKANKQTDKENVNKTVSARKQNEGNTLSAGG